MISHTKVDNHKLITLWLFVSTLLIYMYECINIIWLNLFGVHLWLMIDIQIDSYSNPFFNINFLHFHTNEGFFCDVWNGAWLCCVLYRWYTQNVYQSLYFFFGRGGGGCFGLCVGVCFVTTPPLYYLYIPSIKYL